MSGRGVVGAVAVLAVLAGCGGEGSVAAPSSSQSASPSVSSTSPTTVASSSAPPSESASALPLAGKVVVLDPGHQLGNRRHSSQINALVDAGGFRKACNTTGTATNAGYPEATFAWQVALAAQKALEAAGARVVLTRDSNSDDAWGPCIDQRGRIGNPGEPGPTGDLRVSIHGDGVATGSTSGPHGFHVIRPGDRPGWTDDIVDPSSQLALDVRDALLYAGFSLSNYAGQRGIVQRTDLGTLNHSDIPAVMVELGNMRHPDDAASMSEAAGQRRYGEALAKAAEAYLRR